MRDFFALSSMTGAAVSKGALIAVAPQEFDIFAKLLDNLSTTTICIVGLWICSKRMFKVQDELSQSLRDGSKFLRERVFALEGAVKELKIENREYRVENKRLRDKADHDRHRILELVEEAVEGGKKG
ncbi:MAG: hypothetical protein AB7I98_04005 [Verrucomicrobiales bacterium]